MMPAKTNAERLLIKPGDRVWIMGSGADLHTLVEPLPLDARATTSPSTGASVAITFLRDTGDLPGGLDGHLNALAHVDAVWIGFPLGEDTEITEDLLNQHLWQRGWRTIDRVSLSGAWAALRARRQTVQELAATGAE
ncbi:hypothetical protein GCM10022198_13900 [Klugiella xanthotipulae]|uniref:DUF3052 family protein n=1 Tax=Klugiella xanthotipulae TaxID=244735 RepID=A0A543I4I3_9MICO|nr:hypothetical protein [Klugiella xanthotipulae]TQM65477.1 hypothetical protein FB466_0280 [Klugiella xanthotipulae]